MKRLLDRVDEREQALLDELRASLARAELESVTSLYDGVLATARSNAHLRLVSEQPAEDVPQSTRPERRGRPWLVAAATVGVLASAAWLTHSLRSRRAPASTMMEAPIALTPRVVRSELLLAAGEVELNGRSAEVGEEPLGVAGRVSTKRGRACLGIDPQIDVCLDRSSEIALDSLSETDVVVRVVRGTVVATLSPRAKGHAFSLISGDVRASAHGTIFSLAIGASDKADVVVMEGSVEVNRGGEHAALLPPHARLTLERGRVATEPSLVGRAEEAQLLSIVEPRSLWQRKDLGILNLASGGPWREGALAGVDALPLPIRAFVPAGSRRVVLRDGAGIEATTEVTISNGMTSRLDAATLLAPPLTSSNAGMRESPGQLLESARSALGRGGAKAALPHYRRLLTAYPKSNEAFTVLVTVGQLELNQGAPGRALTAFDAYLKRGGPLSPEALAGRIRALRALGQKEEERTTIERYLASYPRGFEASALRKRLEALP